MSLLKKIWKNNSKHKKLSEEWALAKSAYSELSLAGEPGEKTFNLKYVGVSPVERASSGPATAKAVATAVSVAKASGKKMRRVCMTVSPKGLRVESRAEKEPIMEVSIYKISYCSADAAHGGVFAFVCGGAPSNGGSMEQLECHAFLCGARGGRKAAKELTLAVAQAFNSAYQTWLLNQKHPMPFHPARSQPWNDDEDDNDLMIISPEAPTPLLADIFDTTTEDISINKQWVSFDDNEVNSMWDTNSSHPDNVSFL